MSSIIENLHKILTSRYGRDVRQAIHDAIEDCYEDGRAISINVDPKVTTGTNIADIEINDTTYSLYAEGTVVSIDPKVTEGINIADITVDGQTTSLYGGSATIGGLTDVAITNPTEGEELSYDDTAEKWVNRITRIECTMAQYEAWEQGGTLLSDVEYYVTDAPSSDGVYIDDTTPSDDTVYSSNKTKALVDAVNSKTNSIYKLEVVQLFNNVQISNNTEYNSNGSTVPHASIPSKTGYTPVAIVNVQAMGYYGSRILLYAWIDTGDGKIHFSAFNTMENFQYTPTVHGYAWVLYIKNELL